MKRLHSSTVLLWVLVCWSGLVSAQGGGGEKTKTDATKRENRTAESSRKPASTSKRVRHDGDGVIMGVISYSGASPQRLRIDTSADPVCNAELFVENLVVTNGRLANVFVYVRTGTGLVADLTVSSSPVILDQNRCRFVPHVLGIQKNQTLQIWNSDATSHNVHFTPKNNPEWNMTQPAGGKPLTTQFHWNEVMIPVKNNQHPWMKAYVGVLPHRFFAVSKKDGTFKIEGLQPGQYTIVAWHERLGEQRMDVTISSGEVKVLNFSFTNNER